MCEQPHLEGRRGIMAWRFEEDRSAVLLTAAAIQEEPVVTRQFCVDLIAGECHGAPVQSVQNLRFLHRGMFSTLLPPRRGACGYGELYQSQTPQARTVNIGPRGSRRAELTYATISGS